MTVKSEASTYLILDTSNSPLGSGQLESPPGATELRLLILNNKADEVAAHETVELMSLGSSELPLKCRVLRQRGDRVILENVQFDSFIYPVSGGWRGRRSIQSIDLSCGGIAFYSDPGLGAGDVVEAAIPVTSEGPLFLNCKILKQRELDDGRYFYASKFVNMCEDEEVAIREAVFSLQLQSRFQSDD